MSIKIEIDGIEDLTAFVNIIRRKDMDDKEIEGLISKLTTSSGALKQAVTANQTKGV